MKREHARLAHLNRTLLGRKSEVKKIPAIGNTVFEKRMVERGHRDGVAPHEWIAYEYAKVRRLYAQLGISGRTEIEFFDGGHVINGRATFDFLHRHLRWPKPK